MEKVRVTSFTNHPSMCLVLDTDHDGEWPTRRANLFWVADASTDSDSTDCTIDLEMIWGNLGSLNDVDVWVTFSDDFDVIAIEDYDQ